MTQPSPALAAFDSLEDKFQHLPPAEQHSRWLEISDQAEELLQLIQTDSRTDFVDQLVALQSLAEAEAVA